MAERVPPSGNASKPGAGVPAAAKTVTPPKQQEKPAGPTGFVVASLSGDLKMVIEGESQIVVLVTFREYPKARRGKPQSRSEASRVQRVVPLFARTRQQTREAVIETAREGVYTFRAGSESGEPVKGNFTLRIFGNSKPEKIAPIGPRTVSAGTVVAKVLMPEGILWEDDSAFTGSLEDSDSSTKFNSETGLYWKEYHE